MPRGARPDLWRRNADLGPDMTGTTPRLTYASVTAALVCAGLLCRWPALGLPWLAAKYAGSALWGAMVYAGLRAIDPRAPVLRALTAAATIAISVELSRLCHRPGLDAFRATLAGKLLLSRVFSLGNVVAYAVGIAGAALVEGRILRCRDRRRPGRSRPAASRARNPETSVP